MKVLVAVRDYPNEIGGKALMYVHVRNMYYIQKNIDVVVLNFSAQENYVVDGIKVITLNSYVVEFTDVKFDVLILHAPNIRNHYIFLNKYGKMFPKFIFFFHGHEIVDYYEVYPKPYTFNQKILIRTWIEKIYNKYKLIMWRNYLPKINNKSRYVFVSGHLKNLFYRYVKVESEQFEQNCHIINNSIGEVFEKNTYNPTKNYEYDFVTIRSNLDASTYCIDLVTKIALDNPQLKFLVIGNGKYYQHNKKPENITLLNHVLPQSELLPYINKSRNALMLTRNDTQGVMSCELASYGIPLITSDISVCHEIFDLYDNVTYLNNENILYEFKEMLKRPLSTGTNKFYLACQTISKEVELLREND